MALQGTYLVNFNLGSKDQLTKERLDPNNWKYANKRTRLVLQSGISFINVSEGTSLPSSGSYIQSSFLVLGFDAGNLVR